MRVIIYGHSDDCIEVEGDLVEEFSSYSKASFLHFGDGTVLEVEYSPEDDADYYWRIKTLRLSDGTMAERQPGTYDGEGGLSCDKLILTGDLKSVRCFGSAEGPTRDDIEAFFDRLDPSDLTRDQALRIMAIAEEGAA